MGHLSSGIKETCCLHLLFDWQCTPFIPTNGVPAIDHFGERRTDGSIGYLGSI